MRFLIAPLFPTWKSLARKGIMGNRYIFGLVFVSFKRHFKKKINLIMCDPLAETIS